jgi:hypothetical protein
MVNEYVGLGIEQDSEWLRIVLLGRYDMQSNQFFSSATCSVA